MYRSPKKPPARNLNEPQISTFKSPCPHCGNVTHQHLAASRSSFRVYECDICHGVTFQKVYVHPFEVTTPRGKKTLETREELERLWPPPSALPSEVPERVRFIYEEAMGIRAKSPSSFVVQIRRALEAVASERGAPTGSLHTRIEWMIKNNLLPATFGEMIQITRMFGNLGAHDAEKDVQLSDTAVVDEFFRAVIEYLYVAPAKVTRVKDLLS